MISGGDRPSKPNLIFSLHSYMGKQIAGKELCKLASKRKKLPHTAVDIWRYNRIRQKDSFFFEPLVHGKLVCLIDSAGV
jgi:cohesin complex subunit SCC1